LYNSNYNATWNLKSQLTFIMPEVGKAQVDAWVSSMWTSTKKIKPH